jgi:hypothetical protein
VGRWFLSGRVTKQKNPISILSSSISIRVQSYCHLKVIFHVDAVIFHIVSVILRSSVTSTHIFRINTVSSRSSSMYMILSSSVSFCHLKVIFHVDTVIFRVHTAIFRSSSISILSGLSKGR